MRQAGRKVFIPTSAGSGPLIDGWDASVDFETDAISFNGVDIDWSVQFFFEDETLGTPTATVLVSNDQFSGFSPYKTAATDIDLTSETGAFDSVMPFRFMKVSYTSGGSTGEVSLKISK